MNIPVKIICNFWKLPFFDRIFSLSPFVAILAGLSLPACGLAKKLVSSGPPPPVQMFFVKGDPRQIIAGTKLDSNAEFSSLFGHSKTGFLLAANYSFFREAHFKKASGKRSSVSSNGRSEISGLTEYRFHSTVQGVEFRMDLPSKGPVFKFTNVAGILELTGIDDFHINLLHFSAREGDFSLLVEASWDGRKFDDSNSGESKLTSTGSGRVKDQDDFIAVYYFSKYEKGTVFREDVSSDYRYLLGPGVRAAWESDIEINLCGDLQSKEEKSAIISGFLAWSAGTGTGEADTKENPSIESDSKIESRKFSIKLGNQNLPFSDLNSNCLLLFDDYSLEDFKRKAITAQTLPVVNRSTRKIIESTILMSKKSIIKLDGEIDLQKLKFYSTHEFGHFLGLHHKFGTDDTSEDSNVESVMGYGGIDYVTEYDRSAISLLYSN